MGREKGGRTGAGVVWYPVRWMRRLAGCVFCGTNRYGAWAIGERAVLQADYRRVFGIEKVR